MNETPRFTSAAAMFGDWRDDLLSGRPPVRYGCGEGFESIELGPGLVTLVGGAPGAGKTALVMQLVLDALRLDSNLRAVVANVEMPPRALLDRQLARLSNVELDLIRGRRLSPDHGDAIQAGLDALQGVSDRLAFVRPPFDLNNVAKTADAFNANLIVLDYLQRIRPPGKHGDARSAVGATMDVVRQFADAGTAVIVVAALARGRDDKGRSSYTEGLSLASFRESSELEYGADDAYIVAPDESSPSLVRLFHLKSRYGERRDLDLGFDRPHQRFTVTTRPKPIQDAEVTARIASAWNGVRR